MTDSLQQACLSSWDIAPLWCGHKRHMGRVPCSPWALGLKRYTKPVIRYDTRYDAHDTIRSAIHLPFLPGKQRLVIPACDQKHCTPPTTTACAVVTTMAASLEFPDAVCLWWIHSFYWNILIVFCGILCWFLTLACVTSVPYRIVSSSERIAIRTVAFVSAIYRCASVWFQPYWACWVDRGQKD